MESSGERPDNPVLGLPKKKARPPGEGGRAGHLAIVRRQKRVRTEKEKLREK